MSAGNAEAPSRKRPLSETEDNVIATTELATIRGMTHFQRLGVSQSCTSDDAKRAYRKRALLFHPDKNKSNGDASAIYQLMEEARNAMCDDTRRRAYILKLHHRHSTEPVAFFVRN
jgi:DnaJ-class molecular chaperone